MCDSSSLSFSISYIILVYDNFCVFFIIYSMMDKNGNI